MLIEFWFDGCVEPINPGGHGAWGLLTYVDGKPFWSRSGYCGHGAEMTNNVAEYQGLLAAFHDLGEIEPGGEVIIRGDSKLVINQMSGRWKAKRGLYKPFYTQAKKSLSALQKKFKIRFEWIPREENEAADELSKIPLRKLGIL